MPGVGVEGDERKRGLRSPVSLPFLVVPHHQLAAGVAGWQRHHQGADHRVVLLGILVGEEELVRLVDQERVKIGGQLGGVRQAQLFPGRREDARQRVAVPLGADEVPGDLPGIADVLVGQRLGAAPEPGRLAEADERAGLRGSDRERDPPEAGYLQVQVARRSRQLNAGHGCRVAPQRRCQPVTCRSRHGRSFRSSRSTAKRCARLVILVKRIARRDALKHLHRSWTGLSRSAGIAAGVGIARCVDAVA